MGIRLSQKEAAATLCDSLILAFSPIYDKTEIRMLTNTFFEGKCMFITDHSLFYHRPRTFNPPQRISLSHKNTAGVWYTVFLPVCNLCLNGRPSENLSDRLLCGWFSDSLMCFICPRISCFTDLRDHPTAVAHKRDLYPLTGITVHCIQLFSAFSKNWIVSFLGLPGSGSAGNGQMPTP